MISFLKDLDERRLWCRDIPNQLDPVKVTEHMGICIKYSPPNYETKKVRGGQFDPILGTHGPLQPIDEIQN